MTGLLSVDPFSMPASAGPNDRFVGMSEYGTPMMETATGQRYTVRPQAERGTQPPQPSSQPQGGLSYGDMRRAARSAPSAIRQGDTGAIGGLLSAMAQGFTAPGRAARGEPVTLGDAWATALDYGLLGAPMEAPAGALRSGAMRSADASPAQSIARLLREGRADDVTDEMLSSLTTKDEMELYDLYRSGATGQPMPMDEASRMTRAREMGFDIETPLYHGTDSFEIANFDPSKGMERLPATFFSDSQNVARTYGDVGEYFARVDYPAEFDFSGGSSTRFNDENVTPGALVRRVREAADDAARYGAETETDLAFDLQTAGIDPMYADEIDAVKMQNVVDSFDWGGDPANNLAVFDPRNIRRTSARFDPRLSHLANLSAGLAGGGILLMNEPQRPRGLLE